MKRKPLKSLLFLGTTYLYGIFIGVIFHLLKLLKIIKVPHWDSFPHWQRKIILASNHPSLLEPFLLPALFFPEYLFSPFKYAPWSTPDRNNFYKPWYWFWLRSRAIPVNRGNTREELRALFQMKKVLDSDGIIILFPEGGRTFRGDDFLYSRSGKRIRVLKSGIGWLALKTKAQVVPVWVEGTDGVLPNSPHRLFSWLRFRNKITIKIGYPLRFPVSPNDGKEEITQNIAQALLKLSEEE